MGGSVFGRRWGAKAETLREEMRAKLATGSHDRALLADAIVKLEATLASEMSYRANERSSTDAAVSELRDSLTGHSTDLAHAVEEVARMCARLAEHIESERAER